MKTLLVLGSRATPQFKQLSELSRMYEIQIEEECPDKTEAEALLFWDCKREKLENLLKNSPGVKWIHTKMAGVERLLSDPIKCHPSKLTNAQGVYADSLAEFAIFGMLYFAKATLRLNLQKDQKLWKTFEVDTLKGSKLGILGYGGIGQQIGKLAMAFGMEVVGFRTKVRSEGETQGGVKIFPTSKFDEMISSFDYVSNSMPGVPSTVNFLNRERLLKLKSTAVIINVGRGTAIDEDSMIALLKENKIRGAVLDVFAKEPLSEGSKLWELPNVLLSPHTADRTSTWLDESMEKFIENAKLYAEGKQLLNLVDKQRGY